MGSLGVVAMTSCPLNVKPEMPISLMLSLIARADLSLSTATGAPGTRKRKRQLLS